MVQGINGVIIMSSGKTSLCAESRYDRILKSDEYEGYIKTKGIV